MGIADMLIKMGIRYGSQESIDLCDRIGGALAYRALTESAYLAKDNNKTYPKYNDKVLESEFFKKHTNKDCTAFVKAHGLYNS